MNIVPAARSRNGIVTWTDAYLPGLVETDHIGFDSPQLHKTYHHFVNLEREADRSTSRPVDRD